MMSPFAQMAPLNVASTLEDNMASLPRRRVGESEISTCSKEAVMPQRRIVFLLARILAI